MSSEPKGQRFRADVVRSLAEVPRQEWDALLQPDDAPLLGWDYLQGLEQAGCVGSGTSWQPAHLCLRRWPEGPLLAAAPAYIKADSDGEWVYDFDWPELAARFGVRYYPKLVLAVPFNPVTGRRLLVPACLPEEEARLRQRALLQAAQALCRQAGLSSVHALFHQEEERAALAEAGFALRAQEQYHFRNEGYATFDDFLARLRHGRRKSIRRERRELQAAGVTVTTLRGLGAGGFSSAELDAMFDMYVDTSRRYTGELPYLNRPFFHLLAERLGDRLELVLARGGDGRLLAGAFNLRGDRRLLGRYWGEAEHVPFLHFEVCFYHAIERCIRDGLAAFEPGHGGDQKLLRGFWPVLTYSAHHLRHPVLHRLVARYLDLEAPYVTEVLRAARERCPLRRPARADRPEDA